MNTYWLKLKKQHWETRSAHERRTIVAGTLILSPLLAYFLLWQPAHVASAKLQASVPSMRIQAERMRTQAKEAEMLRHRPRPAMLDVDKLKTALEESALRHHLGDSLTNLEVQRPNAIHLTIDAISFEQWINWLRSLQQEQHIRADSIGIVALPQSGMVKVNATLINGGMQ